MMGKILCSRKSLFSGASRERWNWAGLCIRIYSTSLFSTADLDLSLWHTEGNLFSPSKIIQIWVSWNQAAADLQGFPGCFITLSITLSCYIWYPKGKTIFSLSKASSAALCCSCRLKSAPFLIFFSLLIDEKYLWVSGKQVYLERYCKIFFCMEEEYNTQYRLLI